MRRIFTIFAALLLSVSLWAAGLQIEAVDVHPTGFTFTKAGTLVAALQADASTVLISSSTSGETWTRIADISDANDAVLWRGFAGELRIFFTRNGRILMSTCSDPDGAPGSWTAPIDIAGGYCSSTPVVLRNGAVLIPAYLSDPKGPGVLFSMNRGENWMSIPSGIKLVEKIPTLRPDPILVPYKNGRLLMLNRGTGYQWRWSSVSQNFGRNWTAPDKYIYSPDTPMSVNVLPGGKWLAVKNGRLDQELHYSADKLIAYLSDDEGETWYGDLIIDDRADAVHPCSCIPGNGYIYILYSYKPADSHCCEVYCIRTSEMEINTAVPTRQIKAANRFMAADASLARKAYEKEAGPYLRTNGKPSGAPLNVATFNIEYKNKGQGAPWPERLGYVNELFRKYNFDVVGVQEPFRPEYDQLVETLGDTWDSIFACTDLVKNNFSNSIFFRKERIEMLDNGVIWYTEVPGQVRGFGGASSRNCIWAKFRDKTSGNIFFLFNSHFDFISNEAMITSARLLVSKVREIAAGYPAFCTGDYNCTDANPAIMYLSAGPYVKDSKKEARKAVNPEMTSMGRYKPLNSQKFDNYQLDHIFFTPGLSRVDTWEILCEYHNGLWGASDHNPIKIQWQLLK